MYYTAQWKTHTEECLRIGVAVAEDPKGPFQDVYTERPMFDFKHGALDAHVLKDGERNYLYYSRAGEGHLVDGVKVSDIHIVELGEDFISIKGTETLVATPEQAWEKATYDVPQYWNEGVFVVKYEDLYYLMYSANFYASNDYGIGLALSENPAGPFHKSPGNPILKSGPTVSGPGHNSVVRTPEGKYICVFHAQTDPSHPSEDRRVYLAEMTFKKGSITIDTNLSSKTLTATNERKL
jgi:GH43 family beta-xylosidase